MEESKIQSPREESERIVATDSLSRDKKPNVTPNTSATWQNQSVQLCLKVDDLSCADSDKAAFEMNPKSSLRSCLSKKKRKAKKSVSFDSDAKTWDGKRQEHILLERLTLDFWKPRPDLTVLEELCDARDTNMLLKMRDVLIAAIKRVFKRGLNSKETVELIPGGCTHGIKVGLRHMPYLKQMLGKISEAYDATYVLCQLRQVHKCHANI